MLRALVLALVAFIAVALVLGWRAFGRGAHGDRRARMERSPEWRDGNFVNPQPLDNSFWGAVKGAINTSPHVSPAQSPPVVTIEPKRFDTPPPTGLRITWLGHSTTLIEIDGHRVLTDPIWSDRASPLGFVGPRRWFSSPIALTDMPPVDAVVISHDHYDHLDYGTLSRMKEWNTTFVVPLGVGAHLSYWGIPDARIVELDWWERTKVRDLEIVCTPSRHASGRAIFDDDAKLWAGWALVGATHRAYYSGDTGLFPAMLDIGNRLGPFDVTLIEVGQYGSAWPDWHLGPEQAVKAHQLVRGRVLVPVHWGTFALAYHGWTEPIERVVVAAAAADIKLIVPKAGQSVEPEAPPPFERWWPNVPWKTGAEDPIVSTKMDRVGP